MDMCKQLCIERTVEKSIEDVVRWVDKHKYKAYDPGDGDLSFLRYLTFDIHCLKRVLTAAVLRAPFNIRPWIGIRPHTSTKAMGYLAWGHVKMYALTGCETHRRCAEACLEWLIANRSSGYDHCCWGNNFSFSTRAGTIPKGTPTIVWTGLIGLAFLECYEILRDPTYLDVAISAGEWIKALPRERTNQGTCISYVPFGQSSIHNSNMLGAALLSGVALHTKDNTDVELAREAVMYSCARQHDDGAWFYGEEAKYHWIDSFHTGYTLDSLKRYIDNTDDRAFEHTLQRGLRYFTDHFFGKEGSPKYYHDKSGPIDIQCAAQAIDTLALCSDTNTGWLDLALKVAMWTIENMQSGDGHFYYRDLGWTKVKIPMLHWGQATMFKALAHLLNRIESGSRTQRRATL